jgi:flagellar hook-basal body complex protein FliE
MGGITPLDTMSQVSEKTTGQSGAEASFLDVFKQALQNVEDTQKVSEEDSIKVALGEVDDLHTVKVNLAKAQMALDVLVSMRNTALDAYKEVMSMTI